MNARQVLGWILVALLVLFIAFNLERARIWCFGIRVEMPIGLAVLFSAAMGAGAALLFLRLRKRRA